MTEENSLAHYNCGTETSIHQGESGPDVTGWLTEPHIRHNNTIQTPPAWVLFFYFFNDRFRALFKELENDVLFKNHWKNIWKSELRFMRFSAMIFASCSPQISRFRPRPV